jgi:integrase
MDDYDDDAGTIWIPHTKTGEPRLIAVGAGARAAILRYLVDERGYAPGPLFLTRQKTRLTSDGMQSLIRSLAQSAERHASAHDFRRACAARLLEAGAQLDTVMDQLGHDSPAMSLLYGEAGRQRRSIASFHAIDKGLRRLG